MVLSPRGLLLVRFGRVDPNELSVRLGRALGKQVRLARTAGSAATSQLLEYAGGKRRRFDLALDWSLVGGFQRRALQKLRAAVPYGEVLSYGCLATLVGQPTAARAMGGAMRKNPIPIVVPCHRVTAADGTLGGYSGGLHLKRRLQRLEGIAPLPGGWVSRTRSP